MMLSFSLGTDLFLSICALSSVFFSGTKSCVASLWYMQEMMGIALPRNYFSPLRTELQIESKVERQEHVVC